MENNNNRKYRCCYGNTRDVEIAVQLKYLSNFWRTLELSLINFEINLNL